MDWSQDNGGPVGSSSNSANNCASPLQPHLPAAASQLDPPWLRTDPLRGAKYSDTEGGVRTRAFVAGGLIPPHRRGSTIDGAQGFIHVCDWYATFVGLAGATLHDAPAAAMGLHQPDGLDMW